MAEIGGISGGGPIRRPGQGPAARPGFRLGLGGAARSAEAIAAAPLAGLGLLAAQEAGAVAERDARARRRGEALLDELRGLQRDLLRGGADPGRLRRLAALGEGEAAADPALRDAVEAIALRARIELARRGLAG